MIRALAFLFALFVPLSQAGAEALYTCGVGAGAADGTSLANCWNNTVTWGTGAGQAGRGDTLYVCGTRTNPVTVTLTPSGIGAFDGTANAASDILVISGDPAVCGATSYVQSTSGHNINGSSVAGLYIEHLNSLGTGAGNNAFNQLFSSTSGCVATSGYYCGYQHHLTCDVPSAHCANVASSAATNFPATNVTGIYQHDISSTGAGGSACRVALNATNAIQRRCYSDGDAQTENTWSVYQRGITLNCGAANSGVGVTWTRLNSSNVYKTTQASCGSSISTVIDVYAANPAAGVAGRLTLDAACTNDTTCEANVGSGQYGVVSDTVYINKGDQPASTAAVYLTYAWNMHARIWDSTGHRPGAEHDGVGIGCDFGTDGCLIERGYSKNAPGYAAACGGGSKNCEIRSSLSKDSSGPAGFRLTSGATGRHLSVSGNAIGVDAYPLTGETITVIDSATSGADIANNSRGEGTLTETNNAVSVVYEGGSNPTTSLGFRPLASSPLCDAAQYTPPIAGVYYDGQRFGQRPDIGALACR